MLKAIRYTLATICFAASVCCLVLWGWAVARINVWDGFRFAIGGVACQLEIMNSTAFFRTYPSAPKHWYWDYSSHDMIEAWVENFKTMIDQQGRFGATENSFHFPLWYPVLVFALAGISALRLGRRFTLRSAIIATTVIAGLLGMVVAL